MTYVALTISMIGLLFNPVILFYINEEYEDKKNRKIMSYALGGVFALLLIVVILFLTEIPINTILIFLLIVIAIDGALYLIMLINTFLKKWKVLTLVHKLEILFSLVATIIVVSLVVGTNYYEIEEGIINYSIMEEPDSIILFMLTVLIIPGISGVYGLQVFRYYLYSIKKNHDNKLSDSILRNRLSSYLLAFALGLLVGLFTIADRNLEFYSDIFRQRYYELVDIIKTMIIALIIPAIVDLIVKKKDTKK